jgi:regulator of sigma E protease
MEQGNGDGFSEKLEAGDIIVRAGDVNNPTYLELREETASHAKQELELEVLRADANGVENVVEVTVVPYYAADSNRAMIGIGVLLDGEHAVVAKTVREDGPAIPRGARIETVDGAEVETWYEVTRELRRNEGQRVTIAWRVDDVVAGDVAVELANLEEQISVMSVMMTALPFAPLERTYKASGPIEAIGMGYKKTIWFIKTTYVTLLRLVKGMVSPKLLSGPVGIIRMSYEIVAEKPIVYHMFFLGLISSAIAVFNFLPLPPLDGGLIVLLLVEKIKGAALTEKTQAVIAYGGWILIGMLFLYVTFNDIMNWLRT